MKLVLLALLWLCAMDVRAEEPPVTPLDQEQIASCVSTLLKNPKLLPVLASEMLSYLKRQNAGSSLTDVFGEIKTVGQAGDALIIEQRPGLKLVRQLNFNDQTFATLPLKGREVVQFYVQNDYFVIVTKAPGLKEYYLQIIDPSLARVAVSRRFGKLDALKSLELPRRQGRALYVDDLAVFIFDPNATSASGHGETRLSILKLSDPIRDIDFDETSFGNLPVARVLYTLSGKSGYWRGRISGALMNAHNASRKGSVYADYSATLPYRNPQGLTEVPETPVLMAIPEESPFRAFSSTSGKTSIVHFFWNSAYWNGNAEVATFVYQPDKGWSLGQQPSFEMRFNLDSIKQKAGEERFQIYDLTGVQKLNATQHESYQILMPSFRATSEWPVILRDVKTLFENKKTHERWLQADHREDKEGEFSKTLAWRNVFINEYGILRGYLSSYPLGQVSEKFPVEPERLSPGVSLEHPLLFARVNGSEPPGYLVIDKSGGDTLWVPNLNRIQVLAVGKERRFLFWGEQAERGHVVPTLAIYDVGSRYFELHDERELDRSPQSELSSYFGGIKNANVELQKLLGHASGSAKVFLWRDTKVEGHPVSFGASTVFGSGAKPENVEVKMHPEFNLVTVDLKRSVGRAIRYWVDLNLRSVMMFRNHFEIQVDQKGLSDHKFFVVAAEHHEMGAKVSEDEDLVEGKTKRRSRSKTDTTTLAVLHRAPDGAITKTVSNPVPGQVERVSFQAEGQKVFAVGASKTSGLIKDTESQFVWPLKEADLKNLIYNRVPKPFYDDEECQVFASRGSSESHPKVVFYRKGQLIGHEIELKYTFKETEKSVMDLLMELFFGTSGKSDNSNTQEIAKIDKEGDLLLVTTEASPDRCSITYIYNLRRKALEVAVPNFKKVVDLGKYRFYIGEASTFYPTIVAVVKGANHSFLTHFDFGQVELDTTGPDAIASRGDYIVFKTRTGSERIYDTRYNYFLGTIPKDVKDKLGPIEGSLGHVVNERIFQASMPNLHEREDVFADMQRNFPMRASKSGSQHFMLILPSGAGGTSILNNFMLKYVIGQLSPKPQYRAIFFEMDSVDANADTSFRGQVADKYRNLRKVAQEVRGSGYRLIVLLKRADQLLSEGEVVQGHTEGDLFSNLAAQMDDGDFDVIATSTPGGFEQLQRRKPRFAAKFSRLQRVPAMSPEQTVRGVSAYLKDEFGDRQVIDERQLERVVNRLTRLNVHRALPGPAFSLVKQLVPGPDANPATDEAIDAALAQQTGVPPILLDKENVAVNIQKMRDFLNSRVKGVEDEVNQITRDLFAFALGNNRPDWPISRIMAMGATGTGKGELIKSVVKFLCKDEKALLKISGEDWKDPGHAMRLKALIVSHRNQYPFNIIQLDEWDKMHPENQDVMLSMGDGEIVGPKGEKMSMSLSVLYATSNLGADKVKQAVAGLTLGFRNPDLEALARDTREVSKSTYLDELEKNTRNEVRNRFDRIFIFPHLTHDIARVIVEDYLNGFKGTAVDSIRARYATRDILFTFDESTIERGMKIFFDEKLGARRVAINIENFVKDFLTEYEFKHVLPKGVPLRVRYDGAEFQIEPDDGKTAEAI